MFNTSAPDNTGLVFGVLGQKLLLLPSEQFWNQLHDIAETAKNDGHTLIGNCYGELCMEPRNPDNPFFVIRFLTFLQLLRLAYGEDYTNKLAEKIPLVLPMPVKAVGKRLYVVDWIYGLAGFLAAAFILWNCSQNGPEHLASGMAVLMEVRHWLLALLAVCAETQIHYGVIGSRLAENSLQVWVIRHMWPCAWLVGVGVICCVLPGKSTESR